MMKRLLLLPIFMLLVSNKYLGAMEKDDQYVYVKETHHDSLRLFFTYNEYNGDGIIRPLPCANDQEVTEVIEWTPHFENDLFIYLSLRLPSLLEREPIIPKLKMPDRHLWLMLGLEAEGGIPEWHAVVLKFEESYALCKHESFACDQVLQAFNALRAYYDAIGYWQLGLDCTRRAAHLQRTMIEEHHCFPFFIDSLLPRLSGLLQYYAKLGYDGDKILESLYNDLVENHFKVWTKLSNAGAPPQSAITLLERSIERRAQLVLAERWIKGNEPLLKIAQEEYTALTGKKAPEVSAAFVKACADFLHEPQDQEFLSKYEDLIPQVMRAVWSDSLPERDAINTINGLTQLTIFTRQLGPFFSMAQYLDLVKKTTENDKFHDEATAYLQRALVHYALKNMDEATLANDWLKSDSNPPILVDLLTPYNQLGTNIRIINSDIEGSKEQSDSKIIN